MTYCLNPICPQPQNPKGTNFCQACGSRLLLRERYRALKPIGQGGFGRTFLAVDEDIPSKPACVIKQFFPLSEGSQQAQKAAELFHQEAVRLDELGKHPQIPELLAHFTQDGQQYLVQDFIPGENLAQELANQGPFNQAQIRSLLLDLLPVLQFLHDHQVIHRDIKPANIIRRAVHPEQSLARSSFFAMTPGQLVLVDFGAAKVLSAGAVLQPGTVIGSPEYIAPEQTRGQAIFASDLYSLGATCVHLLTQISPFDLFDIYADQWVWRDYLGKNTVSPELGEILDRMLAANPNQRYASAAEVLQALQPTQKSQKITLPPTRSTPAQPSPAPPPRAVPTPAPAPPLPIIPTITHQYRLTGHFNSVTSIAFSPDGLTLASGSGDKTIEMWNLTTGKRWYTLTGHQDWVRTVAFSPDGQWLASGSSDKTAILWQLKTGKPLWTFSGHGDGVYGLAFSPDSRTLLSGDRQGILQFWPVSVYQSPQWSPLRMLNHHQQGVYTVAWSPDGRMFASGSRDQTVQLGYFDPEGKPDRGSLCTLSGHRDWVRTVAFGANSQNLASGGRDGKILIWNLIPSLPPQHRYTLTVRAGDVWSVAFSPDGQWLASGSGEGTIDLWQVQTGTLLTTWTAHKGDVLSVAFSPDGQLLASGSSDKSIKIWQTPVIRSSIKSTPAFG